ncbi:hypothetical protein BB560_001690 [Smittium megazygosporum]|uniref:Uncharacterized protein n=1 Tax=Smittium megazygosporum TaxID=133381 RepID=A0A2T9ZGU1_9FUNG|nr:hypothetical protein BB560_001690 [Smittium megazygosporum]
MSCIDDQKSSKATHVHLGTNPRLIPKLGYSERNIKFSVSKTEKQTTPYDFHGVRKRKQRFSKRCFLCDLGFTHRPYHIKATQTQTNSTMNIHSELSSGNKKHNCFYDHQIEHIKNAHERKRTSLGCSDYLVKDL